MKASRAAAAQAVKKRAFSRGFKRPVEAPKDLADRLEALIAQRLVEAVSLARKAGLGVTGFEKVKARLKGGAVGALFAAADGAADGWAKLAALAGDTPLVDVMTADELGRAFGRDRAVHAALDPGGATERALREARRLDGFRP